MHQVQYALSGESTPCRLLCAVNSLQTDGDGQFELGKACQYIDVNQGYESCLRVFQPTSSAAWRARCATQEVVGHTDRPLCAEKRIGRAEMLDTAIL